MYVHVMKTREIVALVVVREVYQLRERCTSGSCVRGVPVEVEGEFFVPVVVEREVVPVI